MFSIVSNTTVSLTKYMVIWIRLKLITVLPSACCLEVSCNWQVIQDLKHCPCQADARWKKSPLIHQIACQCKVFFHIITEGNDYLSLSQPQVQPDLVWTLRYFSTVDIAVSGYPSEWQNSTGGESIWFAAVFCSAIILRTDRCYWVLVLMEEICFFSSPVTSCFKGKGSVCNSATEIKAYALVFLHAMTC